VIYQEPQELVATSTLKSNRCENFPKSIFPRINLKHHLGKLTTPQSRSQPPKHYQIMPLSRYLLQTPKTKLTTRPCRTPQQTIFLPIKVGTSQYRQAFPNKENTFPHFNSCRTHVLHHILQPSKSSQIALNQTSVGQEGINSISFKLRATAHALQITIQAN
jgi:hypothetical protein